MTLQKQIEYPDTENEWNQEKEKVEGRIWRVETEMVTVSYECGICKARAYRIEDVEHRGGCPDA